MSILKESTQTVEVHRKRRTSKRKYIYFVRIFVIFFFAFLTYLSGFGGKRHSMQNNKRREKFRVILLIMFRQLSQFQLCFWRNLKSSLYLSEISTVFKIKFTEKKSIGKGLNYAISEKYISFQCTKLAL